MKVILRREKNASLKKKKTALTLFFMTYGTVVACLLVSLPLCRYVFVEDPRGISLFLLPTHPYSPAVLTDQPDNRASR